MILVHLKTILNIDKESNKQVSDQVYLYDSLNNYQKELIDTEIKTELLKAIENNDSLEMMKDRLAVHSEVLNYLIGGKIEDFEFKYHLVNSKVSDLIGSVGIGNTKEDRLESIMSLCEECPDYQDTVTM